MISDLHCQNSVMEHNPLSTLVFYFELRQMCTKKNSFIFVTLSWIYLSSIHYFIVYEIEHYHTSCYHTMSVEAVQGQKLLSKTYQRVADKK